MLQRKYYDLLAEIDGVATPTEEQIRKWQSALNRIYVDELPPMRALDAIAYNTACRALGHSGQDRNVNFWHVLLSQIYSFPKTDFSPRPSQRAI